MVALPVVSPSPTTARPSATSRPPAVAPAGMGHDGPAASARGREQAAVGPLTGPLAASPGGHATTPDAELRSAGAASLASPLTVDGSGPEEAAASRSDGELMAAIARGDEDAFGTAYDRHVDLVYGSLVRFLGDRDAAEELVQEAYLRLWRNASAYVATSGSLAGWLIAIARHAAIDRLRSAARRPRIVNGWGARDEHGDDLEPVSWPAGARILVAEDDTDDPVALAGRRWVASVVRTALTTMPEPERRALELAYDEGLTQTEIAARLGWPLGTVKTRTRRALGRLREVLAGVPDLIGDADAAPSAPRTGGA